MSAAVSSLRETRAPGPAPVPPHRSPRTAAPFVSVVVPAFNEEANLRRLLPRLAGFLAQRLKAWEIVLVDDGSRDGTEAVIDEWVALCPQFRALQLSRNFGKEAALTAGLEASRGEVVVQLDADLQHPHELLDTMLARWRDGADVVYAVRADRRDESWLKRLGSRAFYRMVRGTERFQLPPDAGDFRLMDRAVVDALLQLPERNRFMKGLYAWVGFRAEPLPYVPAPRAQGASHFSPMRLLRFSLDGITGFTTWPLRVVSVVGAALAALAFLYGGYLTVHYLLHGADVPGWTTVVDLVLLFAGIQMLSIGVLGEYVARIFEEVKQRPLYVVRRRVGQGEARG
jgi:glycosyltransferase involved in cell wall biosynthesis